jgi:hypothetical protein
MTRKNCYDHLTSGYEQKACHNFCITPRQFHRDTKQIVVYQFRKTGSGQILQPRQPNLSPGLAKIAPWWLARQENFLAKVPGLVTAGCATNAFCSYPLAVRWQVKTHCPF